MLEPNLCSIQNSEYPPGGSGLQSTGFGGEGRGRDVIENFPVICLQYVHDACFMGEGSPSKPAIHELRAHRPHDNCAIALQTVTILLDRKRTRGHELITYYMERDWDVSGSHVMACYIQGPQIQK